VLCEVKFNMNYWLISDTHFNHTKLEEWGGRSGRWQHKLEDRLVGIPVNDVLIHLGDICIGNDIEVHERIFGKKEGGLFMGGAVSASVRRVLATFRRKIDALGRVVKGALQRQTRRGRPAGCAELDGEGGRIYRAARFSITRPMLMMLSAMTPRPTQRFIPASPL
jgi:hypothetical protein